MVRVRQLLLVGAILASMGCASDPEPERVVAPTEPASTEQLSDRDRELAAEARFWIDKSARECNHLESSEQRSACAGRNFDEWMDDAAIMNIARRLEERAGEEPNAQQPPPASPTSSPGQ